MSSTTKLAVAAAAVLSLAAIAVVPDDQALATPAFKVQEANPTITITNEGGSPAYLYSPAQLEAKAGQAITVTNNDPNGVHTVTAKDNSFSVDVPPKSSVTLKVTQPGNYPYYCTYHPADHNAALINVS
jgi:plastocyanin